MQPDPSSELQYVLSQTTDYNRCKGSVETLHKVCAITALVREIQSPAAVPLDTNPQTPAGTSRHQQLRSEKGNMQVVQRTKKKEHSALASVVVDTLAKSTK